MNELMEKFKSLPMWGKVVVIGGIGLIAYLGIKAFTGGGGSSQATSLQPTSNTAGSQSPFPSVTSGQSSVPLLPSNVNPLYDSQGNLTGYQQAATPPSQVGATPTTPTVPKPVDPFANFFGLLGANVKTNLSTRTYVNASGASVPIPVPASDKLTQGSDNRVWYSDAGGQHLLTSGTGPAIDPRTNTPYVAPSGGGGGQSWQSRIRGLTHYHPQYGDNMNEVAAKLGLSSWRDFGTDSFMHNNPLIIPRS
jgi:hypothetical protein